MRVSGKRRTFSWELPLQRNREYDRRKIQKEECVLQLNKNKSVFSKHRYAVVFFLFVVLYGWLIVRRLRFWKVSDITFAYHVVDYSLGFRAQLLPGAIFYGIFGEHASETTATVYETVLLLLFFVGLSVLLERFLNRAAPRQKNAAFFLLLFYLSGPFTFAVFSDELGMLDVYWLFFSLLFFFFLEKRGLRFLIPALFVLSLLVHFSSVISYLIMFSILLLYRVCIEPEKKRQKTYLFIFAFSLSLTCGLFVFFLFNQSQDLPLSQEAFHRLLQERGSDYHIYYDYSFYNNFLGRDVVPSSVYEIANPLLRALSVILEKCRFTIRLYMDNSVNTPARLALTVLLLCPVVLFFYRNLYRLWKQKDQNKLKRFCVFLMMVQFPFTAVLGCLFSPDIIRWHTHAFLIFFTMLLYLSFCEETFREQLLQDVEDIKSNFAGCVYALSYFSSSLWAYC